jgi:tRNA threonylcarbamoyladenosine biosynthesis protein TsaB
MLILALETSTLTTSVALVDERGVRAEREALASPHSEALLPLIDGLLAAEQKAPSALTAIACGTGPGSFTGLRIGLATAKGLCYALGRPLVAESSLRALALEAEAHAPAGALVLATSDARRGEVYAGLYRLGESGAPPEPLLADDVLEPDVVIARVRALVPDANVWLGGDGPEVAPSLLALGRRVSGARTTPAAAAVGRLARTRLERARESGTTVDDLAAATPAYLRKTAAEEKFPQK